MHLQKTRMFQHLTLSALLKREKAKDIILNSPEFSGLENEVNKENGTLDKEPQAINAQDGIGQIIFYVSNATNGLSVVEYYIDLKEEKVTTELKYYTKALDADHAQLILVLNGKEVERITFDKEGNIVDKSRTESIVTTKNTCETAIRALCAAGGIVVCRGLCAGTGFVSIGCSVLCAQIKNYGCDWVIDNYC